MCYYIGWYKFEKILYNFQKNFEKKNFYIISKVCFLMTLHYFISFHLIFVSKIENNTESLTNFEKNIKQ